MFSGLGCEDGGFLSPPHPLNGEWLVRPLPSGCSSCWLLLPISSNQCPELFLTQPSQALEKVWVSPRAYRGD